MIINSKDMGSYKGLTQERLKYLLSYDSISGVFTWNMNRGKAKKGVPVQNSTKDGYIRIMIDYKMHFSHRLAFLYMTGSVPENIDHINGDGTDNSWGNLRECTHGQNMLNRRLPKSNTSGTKGVSFCNQTGKWRVRIKFSGKNLCFGRWDDLEAAELVSILAREKYHGEFFRKD